MTRHLLGILYLMILPGFVLKPKLRYPTATQPGLFSDPDLVPGIFYTTTIVSKYNYASALTLSPGVFLDVHS